MAHQERALDHDLTNVQKLLTNMGQKVQYMLEHSMRSLLERDSRLAEEIIQFDKELDRLEIQIDQAIYELIALRQPTARDLRTVLAAIKINNDLERMGDYCESICRQAIRLNKAGPIKETEEFEEMAKMVGQMVADCITVFTTNDISLAKKTILADDQVDELAHKIFDDVQQAMKTNSALVDPASALLILASKLERIADQATNICEEVVFCVTGDNIRHRSYVFAVSED